MANRASLYATDRHPADQDELESDDARVVGLSEAAYLVPLSYQLMLSGAPHAAPSLIWDDAPVGIVGDYDAGLARLSDFLDRLAQAAPRLGQACRDTRAFLSDPANRRAYVVLEAGEIFDMSDTPLDEQAGALLAEIQAVDAEADVFLDAVADAGVYQGDDVDVSTHVGEVNALRRAGVGYWSTVLYFDLSAEEQDAGTQTVDAFARLTPPPPVEPRPPIPFWTPLLGSAVLLLSVILSGSGSFISSDGWFVVAFLALYAAATVVGTLIVWGVWWMRHRRRR